MMNLAATLKNKINVFPHQSLQSFLIQHVDEDASSFKTLFCEFAPSNPSPNNIHAPLNSGKHLECKKRIQSLDLVSLVYLYAPISVQEIFTDELLKLSTETIFPLLIKKNNFLKSPFLCAIESRSRTISKKLTAWIKTLSQKQTELFFEGISCYEVFDNFHHESLLNLLSAIEKLPKRKIFGLFVSDNHIRRPILLLTGFLGEDGLVELFDMCRYQTPGLLVLLEILGKNLDNGPLFSLLQGAAKGAVVSGGEANLLHIVFKDYSPTVIIKTFELLDRFTDEQVKSLFSRVQSDTTGHINNTPLGLAFARQEPQITQTIISLIQKRPALRTLLNINATWIMSNDSPMRVAAQNGNREAIADLLENSQPKDSFTGVLDTAKAYQKTAIIDCFDAFPLYQVIKNKTLSADMRNKTLLALVPELQNKPGILTSRWTNQKTLLHHAVIEQDAITIAFLLEQGIDISAEDSNGETAWHLALTSGHWDVLNTLARHEKTAVHEPSKSGLFPLQQIIAYQHYSLTSALIRSLLAKLPNPAVIQSFSGALDALNSLAQTTSQQDKIEEFLEAPTTQFKLAVQAHCDSQQDSKTLLLSTITTLSTTKEGMALNKAIQDYLHQQLATLVTENPYKEKQAARHSLLLFLFSLPFDAMMSLLNSLTLTPEESTQLEITLCHGLVKPALFTQLTFEKHRALLRFLPSQPEAIKSIIAVHFRQSNLSLLPAELLRDFAKKMTIQELLTHSQQRPVSCLILLTLHKALDEELRDDALIETIWTDLNKKLTYYNEANSTVSLAELKQLLELATHPEIKKNIRHTLAEMSEPSPLKIKIMTLFGEFKIEHTLIKASVLRELFINFANDPKIIADNPSHQRALSELLPTLNVKEALRVIKTQQVTGPNLATINDCLLTGILKHPNCDTLLTAWVEWQLISGDFTAIEKLYTLLPNYFGQAKQAMALQITQSLDTTLHHAHQAMPLIQMLQQFSRQSPSFDDLLERLIHTDKTQIHHFIALTAKAQLHDLNRLGRYALSAQEQHWDIQLLSHVKLSILSDPTDAWIQKNMGSLMHYSSSIFSLRALLAPQCQTTQSIQEKLNHFMDALEKYSFTLRLNAIVQFIASNQVIFAENLDTFVQAINKMMEYTHFANQGPALDSLDTTTIQSLLDHCLSGSTSDNIERRTACRTLLTTLCQHQISLKPRAQQLIKTHLNQQDMTLVGNETLIAIAQSVLSEQNNLHALTIDGVWIQRLLTSPRFMAASTPQVIENLVERYRAISLSLKQDELERLNLWLTGQMPFAERYQDSLKRLQNIMLANPERKEELLAKRNRLQRFLVNDSIRALFNQLEDDCHALKGEKGTEADLADDALNIFYSYHNQQVSSLRSDKLFRIADFIYSRSVKNRGDIAIAQNSLLHWLETHLPHRNFQQNELTRKTEVRLYNAAGQEIGFLDDYNFAITFIDDEPINLIDTPNAAVDMVLFDHRGNRLGTLTSQGTVARENTFRNETIAMIVGKMPMTELQKSPAAFNLLIQDCLLENSLATVYGCDEMLPGTEKRQWLEHEVTVRVAGFEKPIYLKTIDALVKHHSDDSISTLLHDIKQPEHARALFNGLLTEGRHDLLFHSQYHDSFEQFLKNNDAKTLLAHYLNQHDKPEFNIGLEQFMTFACKHNRRDLLSEALLILNKQTLTEKTAQIQLDKILQTLIGQESTAKIVLGFICDNLMSDVQDINSDYSDNLSQFFEKSHLTPTITALNNTTNWDKSAQHRLLLLMFNRQHQKLFPGHELRLTTQAWQPDDLKQLTHFTVRHLRQNTPCDKSAKIGTKLLGELAFRAANAGQTDLFYTQDKKLNANLVTHQLTRSFLSALAAQFYIPKTIQQAIEKLQATVRSWFANKSNQTEAITQLLKENHAIIDWKELAAASWSETNSTEMPLICAFLMNFSSVHSEALRRLLLDVFTSIHSDKGRVTLHHITQLMVRFPHLDVSALIFNTLELALAKNSIILDQTVLRDLMSYLHYRQAELHSENTKQPQPTMPKTMASPQTELALIKHLGQQKLYPLIQACCLLLRPQPKNGKASENDKQFYKQLKKIATEARVENSLAKHTGRWYFSLYQFFKRLWNYDGKPSAYIKFCDDKTPYLNPEKMIEAIKTPVLGGEVISAQLKTHQTAKKLKERCTAFFEKQKQKMPKSNDLGIDASAKDLQTNPVKVRLSQFSVFQKPKPTAASYNGNAPTVNPAHFE